MSLTKSKHAKFPLLPEFCAIAIKTIQRIDIMILIDYKPNLWNLQTHHSHVLIFLPWMCCVLHSLIRLQILQNIRNSNRSPHLIGNCGSLHSHLRNLPIYFDIGKTHILDHLGVFVGKCWKMLEIIIASIALDWIWRYPTKRGYPQTIESEENPIIVAQPGKLEQV